MLWIKLCLQSRVLNILCQPIFPAKIGTMIELRINSWIHIETTKLRSTLTSYLTVWMENFMIVKFWKSWKKVAEPLNTTEAHQMKLVLRGLSFSSKPQTALVWPQFTSQFCLVKMLHREQLTLTSSPDLMKLSPSWYRQLTGVTNPLLTLWTKIFKLSTISLKVTWMPLT